LFTSPSLPFADLLLLPSVAGLTHGTLVSLYNRTKTYTGSTRYLCTSGVQSMFPLSDWSSMAGSSAPRAFAPNNIRDVRFVTKTSSWDAFVVYAVDLDASSATRTPTKPLHPSYPTPPPNAIAVDPNDPKPLFYNETVVLQDIATGVISVCLLRSLFLLSSS
jgi:recombining binding protein (suppressor of hairless)